MSGSTQSKLAGLLVLTLALFLFGNHLTAPFDMTHQGWNGGYYGIAARNFLRYGYIDLGFMHGIEPGSIVPQPAMYLRHPPMNSLMASVFLRLFGDSEWSLRLGPYLLSVGSALILFLWMNRVFDKRPWLAAATAISAIATPLWAYYGHMLEPLGSGVIFSVVGTLYFVDRWLESGTLKHQAWALAFLLFGFLWDWAAFYTAGFLGLILWWSAGVRAWRLAALYWGFAMVCGMLLILWIGHVASLSGQPPQVLSMSASTRMGWFGEIHDLAGNIITLTDCFARVARMHYRNFFWPLSIASLLATLALMKWAIDSRTKPRMALLLVPLAIGILHILIFPQGAFIHDYWQTYLAVGLPIPFFFVLYRLLPDRWGTRPDLVVLGLTLLLAGLGYSRVQARWRSQEPTLHDMHSQGTQLALLTSPEEVILATSTKTMPPMILYYADRKADTGCGTLELLVSRLMYFKFLHGPIGGFLCPEDDIAEFRPTLDRLVGEYGWKGPIRIGSSLFWDARP